MKPPLYCTRCGTVGVPTKYTPGSFWIELALWLLFLLPGFIYSVWRLSARRRVCRSCGSVDLIPLDSPLARGRQ